MLTFLSGDKEEGSGSALLNMGVISKNNHWMNPVREEKSFMAENKHLNQLSSVKDDVDAGKTHQPVIYPGNTPSSSKENVSDIDQDRKSALQKQTSMQLWQHWKKLFDRSEFQQIPIIGALLAEHLRKHPEPEIYQGITDLLMQPSVSDEVKALLLDLLAEIATPDSLAQLINLAEQSVDSKIYFLILQSISHIGDNRWDGKFHEELSPILEAAWSNPGLSEQAFLNAIGTAIAEVGAPSGVDQLLLTVSGNAAGIVSEETNRIQQEVAFQAIPNVSNPHAIDVLSNSLNQQPLGTAAFEASGNALAGMDTPRATQSIVVWAQQAPDDGVRNLEQWLPKISDPKSLILITSIPTTQFNNPAIKAVIDKATASIISNSALSITAH
ncbi:hypothetical protein [Methyloglobulus sp.]|uniref:hypothetical protein n=1 Tax=Methyloglobulus sp. TaxID=2518622 RepID=UPI0032B70959